MRQIVELQIDVPDKAPALQAEASRVYRKHIIPLIDQYCNQVSSPETIVRIDRLELDLGVVDERWLERDLAASFEAELKKNLNAKWIARLAEQDSRNKTEYRSKDKAKFESQLELFSMFMRTGILPWWVDARQTNVMKHCLEYLLSNESRKFGRLIRKLLQESNSLKRIVRTYADDDLSNLLTNLLKAHHQTSAKSFRQLLVVMKKCQLLTEISPTRIRQAVWIGLLREASLNSDSAVHLEGFFRKSIMQIASELRVDSQALHDEIVQLLSQNAVDDLAVDAVVRLSDALKKTPIHQEKEITEIINLMSMLETEQSVDQTLADLFQLLPGQLDRSLVSTALLQRLIIVLQKYAVLESGLSSKVESLLVQLREELQKKNETKSVPDSIELDMHFSEIDQIYLDNAGLVILWPFLENLFGRLDLLHEKQFKDDNAMQRACVLLQYLVDGNTAPPEYLLPLNKVLCGMTFDAVLEYDYLLTEQEMQTGEQLLLAVIEHATILKNMSVVGFQNTFLQRAGILGQRDGAWLLRVERETYDIVLDRFPWSFEWVKLPWMPLPLRVEW